MGRLIRGLGLFVGLCATSIFMVATADAQMTNYSTFLYGDRAQGMGGVATGIASDASATFYNPGGLAFQRRVQASASLSLSAITKVTVDGGFSTEIGESDLTYEFNGSVPLFVGIVRKLGSEEEFGVGRHALAVSVVTLGGGDRRWQATVREDSVNGFASLTVDRSDRVTLYGVSYAYRVSEQLGIGLTAYLGIRNFGHREGLLIRVLNDPSEPGIYPDGLGGSRSTRVAITAESLLFRIGGLWNITERLSVGLMFQPPGLTLGSRASVSEQETTVNLDGERFVGFIEASADDLPSETITPWALRFGLSYLFLDNFTGAFDVAIWGPVGSADDPIRQWADPPVPEGQPRPPNTGFYVSQTFYRELVVNAYLGFEWVIADRFPLRWGFLTNFSSVPKITGPSDTYDNSHIDEFGASLAFAVRDEGYDVGLGIIALIGRGTGHRLNFAARNDEDEPLYLPADVETWTVYFTISGAVGAVQDIASDFASDIIGGDDEEDDGEDDGEEDGEEGVEEDEDVEQTEDNGASDEEPPPEGGGG